MHPGRGEPQVLEQFPPLAGWKRPLQVISPLACHMLLAQLTKRLNQEAAQPACRFHILWRGPSELDSGRADFDRPRRTVRKEYRLRRDLFG
jgi:hypothetical protein